MPKPVLSLENLDVKVGERAILHDISFAVNAGEVVGIIGPNGCGKTTLLNAVSGFLAVDSASRATVSMPVKKKSSQPSQSP